MKIPIRKKWGQNFLIDPNISKKIIAVLGANKNDHVLEIGPGRGALTSLLSMGVKQISAIEIDPMLCEYLKNQKLNNITIYNADILKFDLNKMPKNYLAIGNLPYNISTPILFKFMENRGWNKLVVMLQKEVAERIVASEKNKKYGRISIMFQTFFELNLEFHIPKTVFNPQPKVTSSLLSVMPKKNIEINQNNLKRLVEAAFKHRRKKLKHNLKELINTKELKTVQDKRADELSVQEYQQLVQYIK